MLVTVEEIVDQLEAWPNACILPHWAVSAVCLEPGGAFPSYAQGYYERDNRFYQAWDGIARNRDSFADWMRRHVLETEDFQGFRRVLGETVGWRRWLGIGMSFSTLSVLALAFAPSGEEGRTSSALQLNDYLVQSAALAGGSAAFAGFATRAPFTGGTLLVIAAALVGAFALIPASRLRAPQ